MLTLLEFGSRKYVVISQIGKLRDDVHHNHLAGFAMTTANPLAGPSALRDLVSPQFHQNNFSVESYIKNDLGVKLDKGTFAFHTSNT